MVQVSPISLSFALSVCCLLGLFACSSASPEISNQKTPPSALNKDGGNDDEVYDDPTRIGEVDTATNQEQDTDKRLIFNTFCEKSAETEVVKQKLSEYLQRLCNNGQAKNLLTDSLVRGAWDGGANEPKFTLVEPWDLDAANQTTTGFFTITVKLPISIASYFELVAPLAGDVATINKITEAGGATPEITTILKSHSQDGKYHVRGWTVEQKSSEDIEAGPDVRFKITTHVTSRSDQHELSKGSAYLFTSYMTNPEGAITIKRFDSLAAGLQIGNDAYFMGVVRVTSDNKSFPEAAARAIRAKAIDFVKNLYKMSHEAMINKPVPANSTKSTTDSSTATGTGTSTEN